MKLVNKLLLSVLVMSSLVGCKAQVAKYTIDSSVMYFEDGHQCAKYNVICDKNLDEQNLARIYKNILINQDDGLYAHTIDFYRSEDRIDDGTYDIAEIVEGNGNDYQFFKAEK